MTLYSYSPKVALDINGNLVQSGKGSIYAITDTAGATPLTIKDANGSVITGGLEVTPLRMIPGFTIDDHPAVMWRSGAIVIPLEADGARIPRGGGLGQSLVKASANDFDVTWGAAAGGGGVGDGGTVTSGMVPVYEVNGTYTRPSTSTGISVVFTGKADPGPVAQENDRWERLV